MVKAKKQLSVQEQFRRSAMIRRLKSDLVCYIFLLPFFVGAVVFTAYPIILSCVYSFTDFNGAYATEWGIFNFKALFDFSLLGEAKNVFTSLGLTFLYVIVSSTVSLTLSYAFALFVRRKIPGIKVIRVLCYLPCLIPGLASGFLWTDLLGYGTATATRPASYGLFNTWLTNLGLPAFPFFSDANTAMFTLILTGIWGVGGGMIMWLAAFENIPPDLYEAADLDGASYMRKLFSITIPLSSPMIFYNLVTGLIAGLQVFGTYATYGVGEGGSLYFIAIRIYTTAFKSPYNFGLACAEGWLLFIIIAALTLLLFKTTNWVHYGDEN